MKNKHYSSLLIIIGVCVSCMLGCTSSETAIADYKEAKTTKAAANVSKEKEEEEPVESEEPVETAVPVCDGTTVTSACEVDGVMYSKYIYHPAVEEQSHIETETITEEVVKRTCTLCNDGSWSPTCAVGRGACSHHGGVAQYNAPDYGTETHTEEHKVIDSEAVAEYYETEPQQ